LLSLLKMRCALIQVSLVIITKSVVASTPWHGRTLGCGLGLSPTNRENRNRAPLVDAWIGGSTCVRCVPWAQVGLVGGEGDGLW
jgi:hypothetical protein